MNDDGDDDSPPTLSVDAVSTKEEDTKQQPSLPHWQQRLEATVSEDDFLSTALDLLNDHGSCSETIGHVLDVVFCEIGSDDANIVSWILENLHQTVVIQRLSALQLSQHHVTELITKLTQRPEMILPVLQQLNLNERLFLCVDLMDKVPDNDFGSVIAYILAELEIVLAKPQQLATLRSIRRQCVQRPHATAVHKSAFLQLRHQELLTPSVVRSRYSQACWPLNDDDDHPILLDVLVLLQQAPTHKAATSIWDAWVTKHPEPFWDAVERVLHLGELSDELLSRLHELIVLLLLAPSRNVALTTQRLASFVCAMWETFETDQPRQRLIRTLFQVWDETRSNNSVRQYSVSLLESMAERGYLANYHDSLVRRFLNVLRDDATNGLLEDCRLLCCVLNREQLTELVRALLLGSAVDTAQVVRGITLARLLPFHCTTIWNWVIRVLIPSTPHVLDPGVGRAGLKFLQEWAKEKQKDVFRYVCTIMTNTGLIQGFGNYQNSKHEGVVLGYVAKDTSPSTVFAVSFYLRKFGNSIHPEQWGDFVKFVSELVDLYLRLIRERNPDRRLDSWLLAGIEFPLLKASLATTESECESFVDTLDSVLCRFCFAFGIQSTDCRFKNLGVLKSLDCYQAEKLLYVIQNYILSVLMGITLSTAVLGHALDANVSDPYAALPILFHDQMRKLYDMKAKAAVVTKLSSSLVSLMRQGKKRKASSIEINEGLTDRLETFAKACGGSSSLAAGLLSEAFCHAVFVDGGMLAQILCDDEGDRILRVYLENLGRKDANHDVPSFSKAFLLVNLRIHLSRHVGQVSERTQCLGPSDFRTCLAFVQFLMDKIPMLRTGHFAKPSLDEKTRGMVSLGSIATLATYYLRLLTSTFRSYDNVDALFEMDGLDRFCNLAQSFCRVDNFYVANAVVDLLSVINKTCYAGLFDDNVARLSWISLHTVYDGAMLGTANLTFCDSSFLLEKCDSYGLRRVKSIVKELIQGVASEPVTSLQFSQTTWRHWQLILDLKSGKSLLEDHFLILLQEICKLAKVCSDETRDDVRRPKYTRKSLTLPSLAGTNLHVALDTMARLLLLTVAFSEPARIKSEGSPYRHIQNLMVLFSRLLRLSVDYDYLLPPVFRQGLCTSSMAMIDCCLFKLEASIDWRRRQPVLPVSILPVSDERNDDPGSLAYLEELLNSISLQVLEPVLSLSSAWQKNKLKHAAKDAAQQLRSVAKSLHLTPPQPNAKPDCDISSLPEIIEDETPGFHKEDATALLDSEVKSIRAKYRLRLDSKEARDVSTAFIPNPSSNILEDSVQAAGHSIGQDLEGTLTLNADDMSGFGAGGGWGS